MKNTEEYANIHTITWLMVVDASVSAQESFQWLGADWWMKMRTRCVIPAFSNCKHQKHRSQAILHQPKPERGHTHITTHRQRQKTKATYELRNQSDSNVKCNLKINLKTIRFYSKQSHVYYLLLILTDKNAINLQNVQKQHYCLQSFNSMLLSKTMSCDLLPTFICMQHSVKVVSGCAAHQSA